MGSTPPPDTSIPMETSATPVVLVVPPVVDPPTIQVSTLATPIAPSLGSFLDLNLNGLMMGVLFLPKPNLLAVKSASAVAIHTILFRNVDVNFYETLKNCMYLVMSDEHAPIKVLINMLLSFMSNPTNLMSLEV